MKQKVFLLLQYLMVLAGILGSAFLIDENTLKGRTTIPFPYRVQQMTIDSKDRVWLLVGNEVVMIENMITTSFDVIGQSTWKKLIGIDENDQVWVLVELEHDSPNEIYRFDGNNWVFQEKLPSAYTRSDIPCCFHNEMKVSDAKFEQNWAFLEFTNLGYGGIFLQDKQGNMWATTRHGVVRFSSDFQPSFPLRALHVFLTFGGYWIIGVIITSVYFDRLLKNGHLPNVQTFLLNTKIFFLTEWRAEKYHWLTKLSVIGGNALISAFGSAFLSFLILGGSFRAGGEEALLGLYLGFPFGFVVGGGMAMWLLGKQIPVWRVVVVSILVAFLISSLLAEVRRIGLNVF